MLNWAWREAGIVREAFKTGKTIDQVRRERDLCAVEAEALGADISEIRRIGWGENGVVRIATKYGPMHLRPRDSDMLVIRQIFIDGDYDLQKLSQMDRIKASYARILAAGDTPVVIDAGANIGAASMWFATQFPEATFIAVEPDAGNAAIARLNLAPLTRASVVEAAIGGSPGVVHLQTFENGGWGARTRRSDCGIPVVTINQLLAEVPRGKLLIAKIDIEGFESDLFSTNIEWVDEAAAIIIEPHDWLFPEGGTSQSLQAAMVGKGRELLISGENLVFV